MKINIFKVLHPEIMSNEERKTGKAYSVRFYFLIAIQYYNETNKPTIN